jgi:hypothetical protein
LLTKGAPAPASSPTELGGDDCFDDSAFAPEVHARDGASFDALGRAIAGRPIIAALAAARIQRAIRDRLTLAVPFDNDAVLAELDATRALVTRLEL